MDTSAADAADWIAGAAFVLSGYAIVRGEMRSHADKKRRRRVGPADDLRQAVTEMRTYFVQMDGQNGWYVNHFMQNERKSAALRTLDLSKRVGDPSLRKSLVAITASWNMAFGHAPPFG
jgi:hypothetical protein